MVTTSGARGDGAGRLVGVCACCLSAVVGCCCCRSVLRKLAFCARSRAAAAAIGANGAIRIKYETNKETRVFQLRTVGDEVRCCMTLLRVSSLTCWGIEYEFVSCGTKTVKN